MNRFTLEPGKRGGRPCIRGLRIMVYDVLSMLSSGVLIVLIGVRFQLIPCKPPKLSLRA